MIRMPSFRTFQAVGALAALSLGGSIPAQGADCPVGTTRLQQRLLAKAAESPAALRGFIYIRRAILQIDIAETQAWAEAVLTTYPACGPTVAAAPLARDGRAAVE